MLTDDVDHEECPWSVLRQVTRCLSPMWIMYWWDNDVFQSVRKFTLSREHNMTHISRHNTVRTSRNPAFENRIPIPKQSPHGIRNFCPSIQRLRKARSTVAVCSDRAHAPRHRHKTWLFLRIRFKGAHVQFWAGLTLTTEDSVNSASNPYSCNMALEVFWQNWRIKWLWRSRTQAILQVKSSNWSLNNWSAQALANSSALRFPSLRSGFWFLHRPWAATFKTVAVPSRRVSALHTDSQKHNWNKTACCFLWLNQPSPIGLIKYLPIVRA